MADARALVEQAELMDVDALDLDAVATLAVTAHGAGNHIRTYAADTTTAQSIGCRRKLAFEAPPEPSTTPVRGFDTCSGVSPASSIACTVESNRTQRHHP